ncbi:MAG: DUF6882 domain-containing protein [Gammaproteobacteria bacterium]
MGILDRLFGRRGSGGGGDYRAQVERAREDLRAKTAGHDAAWGLGESDWSLDQDDGRLVFTTPSGATATAEAQIIGTYNAGDGTWLWAWDHPDVAEPLRRHAQQLRDIGARHAWPRLTTRKFECTEDEAWELAALACLLCDAQGAYRGPAGAVHVFMTFGEVALSAAPQAAADDVAAVLDRIEHARGAGLYRGYLDRPLPHALDEEPARLCRAFMGAAAADRALLQLADRGLASVLQCFAERSASLAVQRRSAERLEDSLVALGIAVLVTDDIRECLLVMPLPWDAAGRLGTDAALAFERVASRLPDPAAAALRQFAQRSPEDRTLQCMGYATQGEGAGLRYRRTW